jgi:hypothetical protein
MRHFLALVTALITSGGAPADFEVKGGGNGITITKYIGRDAVVKIPQQIGGKPVTAIGDGAFKDTKLAGVVIPDSVTSIGDEAFADNELMSIDMPPSIAFIGILAFSHNQLRNVVISGNVSIGEYAFAKNQLTSVVIPDCITSIGSGAFASNQLTSVTIGANVRLGGYALGGEFDRFYGDNGKQAGTYSYSESKWNFTAR